VFLFKLILILNVDDAGELLDPVQQNVTLLDRRLVLVILGIGPVRFNNTSNFVDATVQSTSSNKSCQFPENKNKTN